MNWRKFTSGFGFGLLTTGVLGSLLAPTNPIIFGIAVTGVVLFLGPSIVSRLRGAKQ